MKNKNWNSEFPEVPKHVHQTVVSTLAGLDERKGKRVRKMRKNKMVILIAAAVVVLGTTVSAAEIFKWNQRAAEVFVADEEQQKDLAMEQIAQEGHQTVSDAGLTIQAIQTIQDNNCFYALFEVTAQDTTMEILPDSNMVFQMDYQGAEDPFRGLGWHFVHEGEQTVSNSRYFEIIGIKRDAGQEDLNMKIQFTALEAPGEKAMPGEIVVEGNWEFALNLHETEPVHYEINKEYQILGCDIIVKSAELSPISLKLVCDEAGARALEQKEGINFDETDSLNSLIVKGIKYKDGTIVEEEGYQELWGSCGGGEYIRTGRLTNVIDVEKVSALLVGESMVEIKLP